MKITEHKVVKPDPDKPELNIDQSEAEIIMDVASPPQFRPGVMKIRL